METADLWGLLSPRLKTKVLSGLSLEDVAVFCKVSGITVSRWLRDKTQPAGEALIRLWYLLRETGEPSPEIESLDPFIRRLGELLAFDVLSAREVQEISGQTSSSVSQVYVTVRHGKRLMAPKLTLAELDELYADQLADARESVKRLTGPVPATVPTEERSAGPVPTPRPKSESRDVAIRYGANPDLTLASLLNAAAPLAKNLNDDSEPERRSAFRDLIGMENLFELSNTLNALCSERARRLV